jgi:hypothetical protein
LSRARFKLPEDLELLGSKERDKYDDCVAEVHSGRKVSLHMEPPKR